MECDRASPVSDWQAVGQPATKKPARQGPASAAMNGVVVQLMAWPVVAKVCVLLVAVKNT